jgi:hypothetical protein
MYEVSRSPSARNAIEHFTPEQADQYEEIEYHLCAFLPALINDSRLVKPWAAFGVNGYRYYDNEFPFIVVFEIAAHVLAVQAILAATTRPPPQARI